MAGTGWHSSGKKVDTGELDAQAKRNYQLIAQCIQENGWENATFPVCQNKSKTIKQLFFFFSPSFTKRQHASTNLSLLNIIM
jgi:hypothetical protein